MSKLADKILTLLEQPKIRYSAFAAIGGITIFLFVQSIGCALRPIGYDFTSYYMSAQALLNGTDPYNNGTAFPYVYPLTLAFAIIPLAVLPYWLAAALWFILTALCLVGVFWLLIMIFKDNGYGLALQRAPGVILVFYILLFEILQNNFRNGQVNLQVLLLCVLFIYCYTVERKYLAAVFLALAIACKLVPGFLILFLLYRGEYRVLLATVLLTLGFCFIPIIITGAEIFTYYGVWFEDFILHDLQHQTSAPGTFLSYNLADTLGVHLHLPMRVARPLAFGLVIGGFGVIELVCRKARGSLKDIAIFSLYLLGMLLLSPRSQTHYLVYLFPALFVAFTLLAAEEQKGRKILIAAFVAIFILLLIAENYKHGVWYFLAISDTFIVLTYLLFAHFEYEKKLTLEE